MGGFPSASQLSGVYWGHHAHRRQTHDPILLPHHPGAAAASGAAGTLCIEHPHLWEPRPGTPYLYTAVVRFGADEYRQTFGVREVSVQGHRFLLNGRPFYFKGPCKHEDAPFHGRGLDRCLQVTDVNLYHWLNANCLRTSHYPYAEEWYDLCDR